MLAARMAESWVIYWAAS
jgi:hypothetical protein